MSIIWYTLYILGAISIVLLWIQLMALIGTACKIIRDKEWAQVKVIQGPRGDFAITSDLRREIDRSIKQQGVLTRKDIESLIRMEVAAYLSKLEISRTSYAGLGKGETKIQMKEDK